MGTLLVCGGMIVAFCGLILLFRNAKVVAVADERDTWNAYAMHLWLDGKPGFYPHELADGTVRWYRMSYEMDNGRPAAR